MMAPIFVWGFQIGRLLPPCDPQKKFDFFIRGYYNLSMPRTPEAQRAYNVARYKRIKSNPALNREYLDKLKAYYEKNKAKIQAQGKVQRDERRLKVLTHYSKGVPSCSCCGEMELAFLSMDHIDGGGSKHLRKERISDLIKWLAKHNMPIGFQVLCMNCNMGKYKCGVCPHKA